MIQVEQPPEVIQVKKPTEVVHVEKRPEDSHVPDANQPISASQLKVMAPGSRLIKIRENDNHNGLRIRVHVTNKTLTAEL